MAQHDENVVWHAHPVTQQQREQHHGHRGVVLWFTGLSGSVNPPSPGRWRRPCMSAASAPICWTAITCAMACAATRDSAMRIAKRTFAASGKWRADGRCRAGGIDGIYISAPCGTADGARAPRGRTLYRSVRRYPAGHLRGAGSKGLYKKARAGELRNFTGIDSVYEAPEKAEIHLDGEQLVTNLVHQLLDLLQQSDIIRS